MPNKAAHITLTGADGFSFDAYHVTPSGTAKGGLVVAMEIFGVNGHIRDVCDRFAADGYDVVAPALYDRAERNFETGYTPDDITRARKHTETLMYAHTQNDMQAAINFLRARGQARVHVTGYCYGGSVAWVTACRCSGVTAAVGYYGRHTIDFVGETPRCPILLHFGRRDASIPLEWVDTIRTKHPNVIVHLYDADHGFNSDRRQVYDPGAAELARARTLAFFEAAP